MTGWQNSQVGGYFRCVYALKWYEYTIMVVLCVVVVSTSGWMDSLVSFHRIPKGETTILTECDHAQTLGSNQQ